VFFLANGKFMLALRSAINLKERHPNHPKAPAAIAKFFESYLAIETAGEAKLLEAAGGNQLLLEVMTKEVKTKLACPASAAEAMEQA